MIYQTILALLKTFVAAIATEATSELIVESKFFMPLRTFIAKIAFPNVPYTETYSGDKLRVINIAQRVTIFLNALTSCGYCLSVWTSGFWCWYVGLPYWFIMIFVVHRLSNSIHILYELLRRGRVNTLDVSLRVNHNEPESAQF